MPIVSLRWKCKTCLSSGSLKPREKCPENSPGSGQHSLSMSYPYCLCTSASFSSLCDVFSSTDLIVVHGCQWLLCLYLEFVLSPSEPQILREIYLIGPARVRCSPLAQSPAANRAGSRCSPWLPGALLCAERIIVS